MPLYWIIKLKKQYQGFEYQGGSKCQVSLQQNADHQKNNTRKNKATDKENKGQARKQTNQCKRAVKNKFFKIQFINVIANMML